MVCGTLPVGGAEGRAWDTATATRRSPPAARTAGRLAVVLGLTARRAGGRGRGAVLSGSLALLADAGHMATDAAGIALALGAVTLAQRPARGRRTFGWQRVEILAAVANGLLLLGRRRRTCWSRRSGGSATRPSIGSGLMLAVASVGLVVNLGVAGRAARRPGRLAERARAPTSRCWPTRWARSR